jgi:hypothetical protein
MTKRELRKATLLGAVVLGMTLGAAAISHALHRFTPPFVQATAQSGGDVGRGAAWVPDRFTFESNGDVLGNGNATWQIFLFSLLVRDFAGQPGLSQITFGPFDAHYPSFSRNTDVDISLAVIAFEADGGLCSDPANNCDALAAPTTGRQIFVYRLTTGQITQVTSGPGDCRNPNISGLGVGIVFDSTTDLLGNGSIATVPELYQGDLNELDPTCPQLPCPPRVDRFGHPRPRGLVRLTTGGGWHGSQSYNGRAIAFESRGDLANNNTNPGVQRVYVLRDGILTQVSFGPEDARWPSLNSLGGRTVAFEQDKMVVGRGTVPQVIVARLSRVRPPRLIPLADANASFRPSVDAKGFHIAFTSPDDLLVNGSTNNQVFTYNLHKHLMLQITNVAAGADFAVSTPYQLLGFVSSADLEGTGNTTPQFYAANFYKGAPPDFVTPFPMTPTPSATPTP